MSFVNCVLRYAIQAETLNAGLDKCLELDWTNQGISCVKDQFITTYKDFGKHCLPETLQENFTSCMSKSLEDPVILIKGESWQFKSHFVGLMQNCMVSWKGEALNLPDSRTMYALIFTGVAVVAATAFILCRKSTSNPRQ